MRPVGSAIYNYLGCKLDLEHSHDLINYGFKYDVFPMALGTLLTESWELFDCCCCRDSTNKLQYLCGHGD